MAAGLILLTFVFLFLFFNSRRIPSTANPLESLLKSFIATGALIIASTEILGLLQTITYGSLIIFWILATATTFSMYLLKNSHAANKEIIPIFRYCPIIPRPSDYALIISIACYCIILALTALATPPNTWDSLTTHMARAAHWAQNHTVNNYPSWVLKQLNYPPGSAYILLHLTILAGNDSLANIPQWCAMIGNLAGCALIARELGASCRGQLIAMVTALTVPMGLLQAVSTQNEQINSLWIISFVYFLLKAIRTGWLSDTMLAGMALALAVSVKGTGLIFGLPFLLWLTWSRIKSNGLRGLNHLIVIIAAVLILNSPFFLRNIQLTRSIIPPSETENMIIRNFNPAGVMVSTLRNLAGHLVLPSTEWNSLIRQTVSQLDPLDPQKNKFQFPGHAFLEDVAGNFLHTFLIIGAAILSLLALRKRKDLKKTHRYGLCLVAGLLIFTTLVRWTPFNTRYHLPLFLLTAPWLAGIIMAVAPRKNFWIAILLLTTCAPWLFLNRSRPWFGEHSIFTTPRTVQYFSNNPDFKFSYDKTAQALSNMNCRNIGLSFKGDSWEYPLWPLLKNKFQGAFRMEHVAMDNLSAGHPYPLGEFTPCAIITDNPDSRETITIHNHVFSKTHIFPFLSLFTKSDTLSATQTSVWHFRRAIAPMQINRNTAIQNALPELVRTLAGRLEDARQVDLNFLRSREPQTAEMFEEFYMKGIAFLMEGIRSGNNNLFAAGESLLEKWNIWSSKNFNRIGTILLTE